MWSGVGSVCGVEGLVGWETHVGLQGVGELGQGKGRIHAFLFSLVANLLIFQTL